MKAPLPGDREQHHLHQERWGLVTNDMLEFYPFEARKKDVQNKAHACRQVRIFFGNFAHSSISMRQDKGACSFFAGIRMPFSSLAGTAPDSRKMNHQQLALLIALRALRQVIRPRYRRSFPAPISSMDVYYRQSRLK
jgi:hypothetical protein